MGHVPHVYLPAPWQAATLPLPVSARHHLERVLRARPGDPVSYTDGAGTRGTGALASDRVVRGAEMFEPAPQPRIVLAVAPPRRAARARLVVEKLAELGVDQLSWLDTTHGGRRSPRPEKAAAWAVAALEQSRGAHLLEIRHEPVTLVELRHAQNQPLWVAKPDHDLLPSVVERGEVIVAIGPEAGFADEEVPSDARCFGLGRRILRVETAAVAAAVLVLARTGRLEGRNATGDGEL